MNDDADQVQERETKVPLEGHKPGEDQAGLLREQGGRSQEEGRKSPKGLSAKARAEKVKELERLRRIQTLQAEIAKRKKKLEFRKVHCAIKYYCVRPDGQFVGPHKVQEPFHASEKLIRVFCGGNRSGKSTGGINEDVAHALGYRPWLPPEHPNYKVNVRVPNKGIICGESFGEQVKKVLVPKLLGDPEKKVPGAIPTYERLQVKKNQQGIVNEIHLRNGSSMFLQSYDQDVDLFESADYDWAHFDEPPPRAIWVAVQRGLADRRGRSWLTMTPLKEPWIYDEIFNREDCDLFYADIEDNLGFGLTRAGIDQFSLSLTPDEREARLRGRYFHLTGLVYKSYGQTHRINRFDIPRHWGMWFHVDTHPRTPHHAVWLAVAPTGICYVCGELSNSDGNNRIQPFIEAVKTYEKTLLKRRGDEIVRLIEPGAQAPDPMRDGHSIADEFADAGLYCKPGSKNRDAGILLMQDKLRHEPEAGVYPTIYFFNDLEGVHFEMTHYVWDDWAKKVAEVRTAKQKPKDKNDHYIEGLHRILLDEPECPQYDDASGERPMTTAPKAAAVCTGY